MDTKQNDGDRECVCFLFVHVFVSTNLCWIDFITILFLMEEKLFPKVFWFRLEMRTEYQGSFFQTHIISMHGFI